MHGNLVDPTLGDRPAPQQQAEPEVPKGEGAGRGPDDEPNALAVDAEAGDRTEGKWVGKGLEVAHGANVEDDDGREGGAEDQVGGRVCETEGRVRSASGAGVESRGRTSVVASNTGNEVARLLGVLLSNELLLAILGHRPREADVDSMDPESAVVGGASDAMRVLDNAHSRDFAALLEGLPRPARHVLLEADRVPDLDGAVLGSRGEEELIRRDSNVGDGSGVFDEVCDKSTLWSTGGALARREGCAKGAATRDAEGDMRTELGQRLAIVVEVDALEELLDAGVVAVCRRGSRGSVLRARFSAGF